MSSSVVRTWRQMVVSLWFIPSLMVLGAVVLGTTLTLLDIVIDERLTAAAPRLFGISAEGARGILTSIATAMLSVAGLVFSITMVTLSLASSQFTSRVLRTFTRDRGSQLVLGVFLGVFVYSLVVLRGIRAPTEQEPGFVPSLSVLLAIVFALVGVGFLVYFIQHISSLIQASEIVKHVTADTLDVIQNEVREQLRQRDEDVHEIERLGEPRAVVPLKAMGYIRGIQRERLVSVAAESGLVLRVPLLVGEFVRPEDTVFEVWADEQGLDASLAARLVGSVTLGSSGDVFEDPRFGIRQLVDVALKALSPGINDPTTAVTCIDYLVVTLSAARTLRAGQVALRDERGRLRLVLQRVGFTQLLDLAFDQITVHGARMRDVLRRELGALERLADADGLDDGEREALRRHVRRVLEVSQDSLSVAGDRLMIEVHAHRVLERLSVPGEG